MVERVGMAGLRDGLGFLLATVIASTAASAAPSVTEDARRAAVLERQVASIMEVLRVAHADPNTACANALDEMNTTDEQLRQLSGAMQYDNETAPVLEHNSAEMGVGRDVLISDMEATVSTCRPQADIVCTGSPSAALAASCAKLAAARPPEGGSRD